MEKFSPLIYSMNFNWKFHRGDIAKPYRNVDHLYFYDQTKAGFDNGAPNIEWDDSAWEDVNLPHDAVLAVTPISSESASHGFRKRDIYWYRKKFSLPSEYEGKRVFLDFDGVTSKCEVYFNGSLLYNGSTSYTCFSVDLTDRFWCDGRENVLAICINASSTWEGWWLEGAGIYRNVKLIVKNPVGFEEWGTFSCPEKITDEKWQTKISSSVKNISYDKSSIILEHKIIAPNGNFIGENISEYNCEANGITNTNCVLEVNNPTLWDINNPTLYTLESIIKSNNTIIDKQEIKFGYRTITICADTGFYLNGKNIKLKGTCNHEDHACTGAAIPVSIYEYRIKLLLEMGSNAYRCAHGMPARELLDTCDRLGMLVMLENRNFESSPEVISQAECMVKRDRNHPSVVMYSICNEEWKTQGKPEGRKIAQRLKQAILKLDTSRPITGAINDGIDNDFLCEEGISDALDITGLNYSNHLIDDFRKKHPDRPMVGSENNCNMTTRGVYETNESVGHYACYDNEPAFFGFTNRDAWKAFNTRPFMMGYFTWTGFDYHGEPMPVKWPVINGTYGSMDLCGFPKDGYYLHKAFWGNETVLHIVPSHWNFSGSEGKIIKVMTFSNCDETEIFLNGKSLGRKTSPLYEQAEWQVVYESGELKAIGFINGVECASDSIKTAQKPNKLIAELPMGQNLIGDGQYAVPINISSVDKDGILISYDERTINFSIEGDAYIIGVANGNPSNHEPEKGTSRCRLFSGKCQIIIGSKFCSVDGKAKLNIFANDMPKIEIEFSVKADVITRNI